MSVNVPLSFPTGDKDSNIYYNVEYKNDDPTQPLKPVRVNERSSIPILEKPSEYKLAVSRFEVPTSNIPLMLWGDGPWDPKTNPGSKVGKYEVYLTFDGTTVASILQAPPGSVAPGVGDLYGTGAVWSVQDFLTSLNTALLNGFTDLKLAKPAAPPTIAPFVQYDAEEKLFTLYAEDLYDIGGPISGPKPATIQVCFDQDLRDLFPSFNYYRTTVGAQVVWCHSITNTGTNAETINSVDYLAMTEDSSTVSLLSDFTNIVFESGTIPVNPELNPGSNNTVSRNILTDYQNPGITPSESAKYIGIGWKRFTSLESAYPLRDITVDAYWETKYGNRFPIYIGYNEKFTMQLLFKKRNALE
jgi:hypothetical protein